MFKPISTRTDKHVHERFYIKTKQNYKDVERRVEIIKTSFDHSTILYVYITRDCK